MNSSREISSIACQFAALAGSVLLGFGFTAAAQATRDVELETQVQKLCQNYLATFASAKTHLAYGQKIDGPRGTDVLASPAEVRLGNVSGKSVPYGYGSGIEDVALHNGHLLFALCDAHAATKDSYYAATARQVFAGLKLLGAASPVPGFVPRGPHPDDLKAYYTDSSLDQHTTFVYGLWRYYRSALATEGDKTFIRQALTNVGRRLEKNGWAIRVEDDSRIAHVGFSWLQATDVGAGTLLAVLAAISDATGDAHWRDLYEQFSTERDGFRWKLLDAGGQRPKLTLYSNQFSVRDAVLNRIEMNPERRAILDRRWREVVARVLQANVWEAWRRLDWAQGYTEAPDDAAEQQLHAMGLSLKKSATVFDLWNHYRSLPRTERDQFRVQRLCVRIPMGAFHTALLSGQSGVKSQVASAVHQLLRELDFNRVDSGETYYLAVVLGLHLIAQETR